MAVPLETTEVMAPASAQEAVQAFGDGRDVTVVAGGTIVMPDLTHGRQRPRRALLLAAADLAGVTEDGGRTTIGAMTSVADLQHLPDPIGDTARHVADPEIRRQATLGGNLCAPAGAESPRGDLQAALIAVAADVRSAGAGGERTESVESLLAGAEDRLVLDVSFGPIEAGARAAVRRPHAHAYTILSVCAARVGGEVRLAASGAAPGAVRLRAAEQAFAAADAAAAAERALDDADPRDDALASAWYRGRTLPVLVRRALEGLS